MAKAQQDGQAAAGTTRGRSKARKAAAETPQDAGAEAPVSQETACLSDPAPADGDAAAPRKQFPGIGGFPADWVQTPVIEADSAPVESTAWALPVVPEFPATLTLVNNSGHHIRVAALSVSVLPYSQRTVQCETRRHFEAVEQQFAGRARQCGWDSVKGLQVKHGEN